jgi:FkbM family methyltransferase
MQMIKRFLSPAGREKYSDIYKYVTERLPRLYDQIVGKDLRYFPQIWIRNEHLGSRYDGKQVCTDYINPDSVVYSFGIGRDISFDLALIERFGVNVYAFDPTPISKDWLSKQQLPERFHFFDFGVADYDGFAEFHPFFVDDPTAHDFTILKSIQENERMVKCPVYRMKTIISMFKHQKIDILKMDVEGSEYTVINDILSSNIEVKQLLVEFHHRFENVGLRATDRAIKALNDNGYKIFSIAPDGQEYSFIRL